MKSTRTLDELHAELESMFPGGEVGDLGDALRALRGWLLEFLSVVFEEEDAHDN